MRTYLSRFPGKREGWGKGTTAEERETDGPTCVNSRDDESVRQDRDVRRKINEATGCGVDAHSPRKVTRRLWSRTAVPFSVRNTPPTRRFCSATRKEKQTTLSAE